MKTGDIIKIEEKELEILKTHHEEKKDVAFLLDAAATRG